MVRSKSEKNMNMMIVLRIRMGLPAIDSDCQDTELMNLRFTTTVSVYCQRKGLRCRFHGSVVEFNFLVSTE